MARRSTARHTIDWALGTPWRRPLELLRGLIGLWAVFFAWTIDDRWPPRVGPGQLLDADLVAQELPHAAASILRHPLLADHPAIWSSLAALTSLCLTVGFQPRAAAFGLWFLIAGYVRISYPLASEADELLAALLLWQLLLPQRGCEGCRATVCLLLVFLLNAAPGAEPRCLGAIGLASALGFAALLPKQQAAAARLVDARLIMSFIVLLLALGTPRAASLSFRGIAHSLESVAVDLALLRTAPMTEPQPDVWIAERAWPATRHTAQDTWPSLAGDSTIWSYLRSDPRWSFETPLLSIRIRAAVRQGLADRACRNLRRGGVFDVIDERSPWQEAALSFRCADGGAHLIPSRVWAAPSMDEAGAEKRKLAFERRLSCETGAHIVREAELIQYVEDAWHLTRSLRRRAPLPEILRVAQIRTAAREFDEAIQLVELVVAHSSPRQRTRAKLHFLLTSIRELSSESW